jgi:enterochelin esterase-like enzyme
LTIKTNTFGTVPIMLGLTMSVLAQVKTDVPPVVPGAKPVTVEHIKVHGTALEGNLEGDAVDRDVIVLLPPGYASEKSRGYPVVYALHGYSIGAEQWTQEIHVPQTIEGAFAQGAQDMIVVLPDSKTVHNGSMYSSSVTTGDFEQFIAHDLVGYIDAHYRTIARRTSRGLVGHSMGGYGASRIGMNYAFLCMVAGSDSGQLVAHAAGFFVGARPTNIRISKERGWRRRAEMAAPLRLYKMVARRQSRAGGLFAAEFLFSVGWRGATGVTD